MSEQKKILAFYSPYPGAGKTTAAEYIAYGDTPWNHRGDMPALMSFADPLRSMATALFSSVGLSFSDVECWDKNVRVPVLVNLTPRDILIWLGQSGRERMGKCIWSRIMRHNIWTTGAEVVVIDDLRFPEEYRMLWNLDAKIVRIVVPGREIVPGETEALLEGLAFDAEIVNTLDDRDVYAAKVASVYEALIRRDNS